MTPVTKLPPIGLTPELLRELIATIKKHGQHDNADPGHYCLTIGSIHLTLNRLKPNSSGILSIAQDPRTGGPQSFTAKNGLRLWLMDKTITPDHLRQALEQFKKGSPELPEPTAG